MDINNINSEKIININGTATRYQMKKVIKSNDQIIKLKKKYENNINQNININQIDVLNNIKINNKNDILTKEGIKAINTKLSSYKQQDVLKEKYNKAEFITLTDLINILDDCNLTCYYCNSNIYILYDIIRDNKQWTLDRIDNEKGHNKDNVVIACLECNLKRRNINKDAFLFTKQLKIIREEYID